jgi:hypothetical protein
MWLLWLASEYVLATRDRDFLGEPIPAYPRRNPRAGPLLFAAFPLCQPRLWTLIHTNLTNRLQLDDTSNDCI